jgi:hypothetical protein
MTRGAFSLAFKIKAARLMTDRGVAVAQAAWGLDLAERVAPLDAGADRNACCGVSREWADADLSGRDFCAEARGRPASGGA